MHTRRDARALIGVSVQCACYVPLVSPAGFGHGERALNAAETKEVIKVTNGHYKALMAGETDAGKLWLK